MKAGLSDDQLRDVYEAVRDAGTATGASETLQIPARTVLYRLERAIKKLKLPDPRSEFVQARSFTVDPIPQKVRPLDQLLEHRRQEAKRSIEYEDFIKLIPIKVKTDGPYGIMVFGDPHIDNPGCDFPMLEKHLKLAADRKEYVLAGNIGDLQDNWIGRLERLYADTTVNAKEIWALVEWMMRKAGVQWTWLVKGNHDLWSGRNDPLDWIVRGGGVGVSQSHGLRLKFISPSGSSTTMHARHDFSGNSLYNPMHALKKETLHGFRDHIIVAGHRHIGADARDVNGDQMPFVMIRVSGYKVSDGFRHQLGLHAKPLHPSVMIMVNPDEPETSPNRVWTAPSPEVGADMLDFLRNRFNARVRVAAKKKGR